MIDRLLLSDIGVIALVYQHWNSGGRGAHQVLTRLARYFHVVWVDPAHEWRQTLKRPGLSLPKTIRAAQSQSFRVYAPDFWLPKLYRPEWLATYTFNQRLKRARSLLLRRGCRKIILYLWHYQFAAALFSIPFDLSCYHINDEYSFSEVELPMEKAEAELIAAVDQVFITSPGLLERKGMINAHTLFIGQGVDYHSYATTAPEPGDIASIPHSRIGYAGVLKKQINWSLLLHLTQQHPEWSFVFIGPRAPHCEVSRAIYELAGRRNVHFLGLKTVHDLVVYPQHFDICIMPYQA